MLNITVISDTHGYHSKLNLQGGELLIHCGDVSHGSEKEIWDFIHWFDKQAYQNKIFIAGNMDYDFEENADKYKKALPTNIHYLENEAIEIERLKIWGSPVVPNFVGVFNETRGEAISKYWNKIPDDVDILITHTPPMYVLDRTSSGAHVGCEDLLYKVKKIKPQFHLFGHVHEAYGKQKQEEITFVNASFLKRWRPGNKAIEITI